MDSNHRCLDVSQESWPLDHGTAFIFDLRLPIFDLNAAQNRQSKIANQKSKWTHRESHPNLRFAEPASSCWTMSPISNLKSQISNLKSQQTEAVGLEPTSGSPPPVFGTGPSSSRMTSLVSLAQFRELESNQRRLGQSQASRPTATAPE